MEELQKRRYKEVKPEETVKRLKRLLNKMKIDVEEKWSNKSSVDTYSLRVCIKGTDIGQNGKGMTKEFAMASAYAEFFERLQNCMFRFRMEKPTKELPFTDAPDEKHLTIEELMKDNNSLIENILRVNNYENKTNNEKIEYIKQLLNEKSNLVEKEDYISLPYYSLKNRDIEYIPNKLHMYLYNSNGMCAGNSPEEALIEGLSEIFERYVNLKILNEKITLPEIPENYIKKFPQVMKMVEKLKQNDQYYFRLVDCSLGGRYPVAGLYIIEKNTGRFGFKLGAHPDYGVAMERCFTEAAQGRDVYEYAQTCSFDFYQQDNDVDKNLAKFIFENEPAIPYQIIGEKSTYEFYEMPDVYNLDNKTILKNMINCILEEGRDILIRNLSVSGFPTYSIIIPGMSELSFDPNAKYFYIIITMQNLLKDFKNINVSNISEVIKMMEIMINKIGCENLELFMAIKDSSILPFERLGKGFKYLLAICYIMNEEYEKAAKVLKELIDISEKLVEGSLERIIVRAVYYYASAMDKLKEHKKAMYYINLLFDSEIADAIDKSFKDRENILVNHYGITQDDYVDNDDSYYMPFMQKFREIQRDNLINQINNKDIFVA